MPTVFLVCIHRLVPDIEIFDEDFCSFVSNPKNGASMLNSYSKELAKSRLASLGCNYYRYEITNHIYSANPGVSEGVLTEHRRLLIKKTYLADVYYALVGVGSKDENAISNIKDREELLEEEEVVHERATNIYIIIGISLVCGGENMGANTIVKLQLCQGVLESRDQLQRRYPKNSIYEEGVGPRELMFQKSGYLFKSPALLTTALTHKSAVKDGMGYEIMEWLGDGVVEYCLAKVIYTLFESMEGSEINCLKSLLAQNKTLGLVAGVAGLHHEVNCADKDLRLVLRQLTSEVVTPFQQALLSSSGQPIEVGSIHKIAGDIAESTFGAEYLDSGLCLNKVTKSLFKMGFLVFSARAKNLLDFERHLQHLQK